MMSFPHRAPGVLPAEPGSVERALEDFREVVGGEHVITDSDRAAPYSADWTGRYQGWTPAVVRPADTGEVVGVVTACAEHDVRFVPQGGNTGLVGGGVPHDGEVVLSLGRLDDLGEVDTRAAQVTAGAGVTLAALQDRAQRAAFRVGIDFGARDSATVGGIVATNAGGNQVVRFGATRAQVVGIEAVLADGRVVRRMSGLLKDNCGYDLTGLLVGSEGTLGVITAARFRLFPDLAHRMTALVAVDSTEAAIGALARFRSEVAGLEGAEFFFDDGLALVCDELSVAPPFTERSAMYVLFEFADRTDLEDRVLGCLQDLDDVRDATTATTTRDRRSLWRFREGHTEAIARRGVPLKLDVSVPLRTLGDFVARVETAVGSPHSGKRRVIQFGHLAEGNVHVNILGLREESTSDASRTVLAIVKELGGSVSAEHGIGRAKAAWLSFSRSPEDITAMQAIKRALDPRNLLNPHVLFADGHAGGPVPGQGYGQRNAQ